MRVSGAYKSYLDSLAFVMGEKLPKLKNVHWCYVDRVGDEFRVTSFESQSRCEWPGCSGV